MTAETREERRERRRERRKEFIADAAETTGCCVLEALAGAAAIALLIVLPAWLLLT